MLEALQFPLMQHALVAGLLVGFLASYYGVFVVQRRQAFLGSGLGHAAFGGVGLGLFLGLDPMWTALPYTVIMALLIVWIGERTTLATDTIIGICFAVSMALGLLFLSFKEGFRGDAYTYLFGSILYTTPSDLAMAGVVVIATLIAAPYWRRWAYATFDPALARADGLPVLRDDMLLAVAVAVVIAVSIKLVGMLLIAAFLVLPAATARLLCRTFSWMTRISVLLGMATAVVGLYGSYFIDLSGGPAIILVQAAVFFSVLVVQRLVARKRARDRR